MGWYGIEATQGRGVIQPLPSQRRRVAFIPFWEKTGRQSMMTEPRIFIFTAWGPGRME